MRIWAALKADLAFQYRHGFYAAYLVVTLFYIVLLRLLPAKAGAYLAPVLLFTDPAVLGFFFVGGLVLYERKQNLLTGFLVTPLRPWEYLFSKAVSLALISLITSLAIIGLGLGSSFNLLPLVTGVLLTAPFFTLVGVTLAVGSRTLNGYMLASIRLAPLFAVPLAEYFGFLSHPLLHLVPGRGGMFLIAGSLQEISRVEILWSALSLIAWLAVAFVWARRSFYRRVVEGGAAAG